MLQEYFEVVDRNNLIEKLARKREENANIAQGAGALGPDASTEQPVVEPSRVVTASLHITDFADGMGRILAQSDFHKRASFQKEALNLAGAGQFLLKNRTLAGAGVGAAGGALAGGPDHRISGALGGAALGAAGGHAGGGIYTGMAGGQTLGQAATAYGKGVAGMKLPVATPAAATPAAAANTVGRRVSANKLRPRPAAPAAGQVAPQTSAAAGQVVTPQAAVGSSAGQVVPQAPITPGQALEQNAPLAALSKAKQQRVSGMRTRVDADMAVQDGQLARAKQQRVSAMGSRVDASMAAPSAGQVVPAQAAPASMPMRAAPPPVPGKDYAGDVRSHMQGLNQRPSPDYAGQVAGIGKSRTDQLARVKADAAARPYQSKMVVDNQGKYIKDQHGKIVEASLRRRFVLGAVRQGILS